MKFGTEEKPGTFGLEAGEAAYLQILNAVPDMILVKGPASRILWANRAFCDFYGQTNEQLAGIVDAEFNQPDYTAQYVRDDEQVFRTGRSLDIPEEPVTRYDGVVRMFNTVKSPIFDASGKVIMTIGISRDITEKLEVRRALEFERARAVHSSKMVTLGEMAAGVAHEVNTPLAIIHGLAGQILDELEAKEPDPEFVKTSLRTIESTAMRISTIIRALNKFARDSSSDDPENCSVAQLVEDALAFAKGKIAWHGIRLEVVLPEETVRFECNPTLIAQVLLNLLTNARDAVIPGPDKWIRLEVKATSNQIEFSVTDGGAGIPAERREKVFLPFYTTKASGQGTGLGLSISQAIVDAHGGRIFLDTEPGPTRFVVQLPKAWAGKKGRAVTPSG